MDDEHHGLGARVQVQLNLCLWPSKVEEDHVYTVIGGHAQTLEGLLEEHRLSDAHLLSEQAKALVDVHSQVALLPVPAAGCGDLLDELGSVVAAVHQHVGPG